MKDQLHLGLDATHEQSLALTHDVDLEKASETTLTFDDTAVLSRYDLLLRLRNLLGKEPAQRFSSQVLSGHTFQAVQITFPDRQ